jgi:hypothetical protein
MDWKVTLDSTFSDCLSKRNVVGLLLFWLTGIVLVAVDARWSGRFESEAVPSQGHMPGCERSETGALIAWRRDCSSGAEPAYKVTFDNLHAENGNLGVFKTASLKVVYVENVRALFSADGSADESNVKLSDFYALFAPRPNAASSASPLGLLNDIEASNADWSVPVDMANTTEVRIRQLDWSVCQGNRTVLRVQCQHATLRSDTPRMVLRGHVRVTTPEAVLESNCVEMNAADESIVVPGRYLLKCEGTMRVGLGERFSKALKAAAGDSSDTEREQGWANGFRLGSF